MTQAYMKTYVTIKDIMELFDVGFEKAKVIFIEAKKIHSKNYSSLENQVLLEKVLESQGIQNFDFWYKQQERKTRTARVKMISSQKH